MALNNKHNIRKKLEESAKRLKQVNQIAASQRSSLLPDSGLDPIQPASTAAPSFTGNGGNNRAN